MNINEFLLRATLKFCSFSCAQRVFLQWRRNICIFWDCTPASDKRKSDLSRIIPRRSQGQIYVVLKTLGEGGGFFLTEYGDCSVRRLRSARMQTMPRCCTHSTTGCSKDGWHHSPIKANLIRTISVKTKLRQFWLESTFFWQRWPTFWQSNRTFCSHFPFPSHESFWQSSVEAPKMLHILATMTLRDRKS